MLRPRAWRRGPTSEELDTPEELGAGQFGAGQFDARRFDDPAPDDLDLKPTAMRGTEAMYGYVVALELIGVSILNLTVTHGKGAPKHPSTGLAVIGLACAVALVAVVRVFPHRLIVPLAAIVAAFFVTLPKAPNSLALAHLFALILPVVYAFVLTQRQRKAATGLAQARRAAPRPTPAERRNAAVDRRRSRKQGPVPSGPTPNRRYTPPKGKRPRR